MTNMSLIIVVSWINCYPGDVVLADRGFDIHESVGVMGAEVKIPSFTKGRQQLSAVDVESSRSIAHVRIHVERVIGLLRNKYTILQDTIPIDLITAVKNSTDSSHRQRVLQQSNPSNG